MRYRLPNNEWDVNFAEDYSKNLVDIDAEFTSLIKRIANLILSASTGEIQANDARLDFLGVLHDTLKDRLDSDAAKVLAKADLSYVETMLAAAVSGAPKGVYTTFNALTTAYPQGTDGVFLVLENGHIYIWNGTSWTDAGVYQGIEVGDKSITEEKTSFFNSQLGKNLYNPNDKDIINNYYMNANGVLFSNSSYFVTGFIEVPFGKQLLGSRLLSGVRSTANMFRFITVFDENKNVIPTQGQDVDGIYYRNNLTSGKKYVRFTINKTYVDIQIEVTDIPSNPTSYEPYKKTYFIPSIQQQINELETSISGDYFELSLPNEIVVPKNTTIELYNNQICKCGNINNFHFRYTCSIGKTLQRKFLVSGAESNIGDYPLKIEVFDNNYNLVLEKTITLKVLGKGPTTIASPKKVMHIGDSLSNEKLQLEELITLSSNLYGSPVLENVGTLGSSLRKHEGRSGFTAANYASNTADGWNGNVKVLCSVTNVPVSKKQYKTTLSSGQIGIFEVESYTGGYLFLNRVSGQGNVNANSSLTEVSSGVSGDATINYTTVTVTSFNPFWNPNTNKVDFTYYQSQTGIKPDVVQFFLGTNDLFNDLDSFITNMTTLVNAVKRDWNIPVLIVLPPYRSNQDGIGYQSGNKAKFDIDNLTFEQNKRLLSAFGSMSGVYIVPVAQTMDSEYNYGANNIRANYRNTSTTIRTPVESVHPQDPGYLQFADAMWGAILKIIQ